MNENFIPPKGFKLPNSYGQKEYGKLKAKLEKNKEDIKKMLLSVIEIIDGLDLILEEKKEKAPDEKSKNLFGKLEKVRGKLEKILFQNKVYPMELASGKAELGHCEIIETVEREDKDEDVIVQVLKKGYFWEGQVLRVASVVTVKNKGAKNGKSNRN